jgi:hypothetical protein
VRRKRSCIPDADTVQPSAGTWQEEQERPFVPSDWKNAPLKLIGASLTLYVSSHPLGFGSGSKFGSDWLFAVVVVNPIAISEQTIPSFIRLPLQIDRPIAKAFANCPRSFFFIYAAKTSRMPHTFD